MRTDVGNDIYFDIVVVVIMIVAAIFVVRSNGLKRGGLFLGILLLLGIVMGVVTTYFSEHSKYAIAGMILVAGALYHRYFRK